MINFINRAIGFDILAKCEIPNGFGLPYILIILATIAISLFFARLDGRRQPTFRRVLIAFGLLLSSGAGVALITTYSFREFGGQGREISGDGMKGNLIVPLPMPGLRATNFQDYLQGGSLYPRTSGLQLRQEVFNSENMCGTIATMVLHLLFLLISISSALYIITVTRMQSSEKKLPSAPKKKKDTSKK